MLFLTARDSTEDKVRPDLGGDDYLQKPFSLDELIARAHAVLRRTSDRPGSNSVLECADLVMDDDAHRVRRAGEDVALSPTEYNLLRYLLINQGRAVSKAQILDHVWHYDFGGDGASSRPTSATCAGRSTTSSPSSSTRCAAWVHPPGLTAVPR